MNLAFPHSYQNISIYIYIYIHIKKEVTLPHPVLTFTKMNPVHILPCCLFINIHSSIILPSMARFSKRSLHFRFSDQNFGHISLVISTCFIQCVPLAGSPRKYWFTKRTKVQYICIHTCNEVRLCFGNLQKGSWQHEKIR
jgi:hypothetical protein